MIRFLACVLAIVLLAACSNPEPEAPAPSPEDEARASQLLAEVRAAGEQENWEGALALAEQLKSEYPASLAAGSLAQDMAGLRENAEQAREERRLRDLWAYQAVAIGKGQQRTASIYSRTPPVFEGEMAIQPDAQLVLRDHPEWGRSAYLLFAQKRFQCGSPCAMQISFDDGPARQFAGKQADSGKGPALFIKDEAAFVAGLSGAKKLSIQLPKDSGSVKSLQFEVAGFSAARYAKP